MEDRANSTTGWALGSKPEKKFEMCKQAKEYGFKVIDLKVRITISILKRGASFFLTLCGEFVKDVPDTVVNVYLTFYSTYRKYKSHITIIGALPLQKGTVYDLKSEFSDNFKLRARNGLTLSLADLEGIEWACVDFEVNDAGKLILNV
eukprot:Nk52_evm39s2152 gene=Nk52_evmTU39s2152